LEAAGRLNARGVGGILDLLGEGFTDVSGVTTAVEQYCAAVAAAAWMPPSRSSSPSWGRPSTGTPSPRASSGS
jgi:hypothetical protein